MSMMMKKTMTTKTTALAGDLVMCSI